MTAAPLTEPTRPPTGSAPAEATVVGATDSGASVPPAESSEPGTDHGVDALTADGGIVRIRPAVPGDASGLAGLHERASDDTLYRRFLYPARTAIPTEVTRLVRPPDENHLCLVAAERGQIVAVGTYERMAGDGQAEFSIFVDDGAHDRGIGTLLLEHLTVHARRAGITDLVGEVLPSNNPMLTVAAELGQPMQASHQPGIVEIHLDTAAAQADALDERDRSAEWHSLAPLLRPHRIAVVGAGRSPGGIGHAVLRAVRDGGFTGQLYAVNPHADQIAGVPAVSGLDALPEPPDLVLVAVPAAAVGSVLRQAVAAGARAAVVLSSGFSEEGPDGHLAQAELVRIARAGGMRLVGPNCLGVVNTDPQVRMNATFAAGPQPGGLAIASQSGAVGITILDHASRTGVGVASFVSLGNKADVSGNDLLSYWYSDPAAKAVALYLESLGNPRRFGRVARAVARRKPVLAVKSGRTASGVRAGASHTAAAAAPDVTVDALFAQAGVIRCDNLGDLLDAARLLVEAPLPTGNRIAILGNAGGANVLAADPAEGVGLSIPDLSAQAQAAIRAVAPAASTTANPVDLGAGATALAMQTAIRAAAEEVDAILVVFGATLANDVPGTLAAIAAAADEVAVPIAVVLLGMPDAPTTIGQRRAPIYPLPEQAIRAMGHAAQYGTWRAQPLGQRPEPSGIAPARARLLVEAALAQGGGWQEPDLAAQLLGCYGIAVAAGRTVSDAAGAVAAAHELGYPVVLKSADPDLVHKSDVGAVRLNLTNAEDVHAAYEMICDVAGDPRVLVQAQAQPGTELIAGIVHDRLFGSLVMLGFGGVQADLLADRVLRLLPVTDRDAAAMWRGLREAPLLTGYRGATPVDTAAIEDLVLRLGRLADDLPEVAELDLNPVLASAAGVSPVDVKLRLAPVGEEPDPVLRMLREPA